MNGTTNRLRWAWLCVPAALLLGCGRPQETGPNPPHRGAAASASQQDTGPPPIAEYWDVSFMGGAKVGSTHTRITSVEQNGRKLLQIAARQQLQVGRGRDVTRQTLDLTSLETPDGRLLSLSSKFDSGSAPMEARGQVESDSLRLLQKAGGAAPYETTLPWDAETGGYFAVESSLRRRPLEPGQTRQLKALAPVINQVIGVTLQAADDYEDEPLLDGGRQKLLRIESTLHVEPVPLQQVVWCDQRGQVLKSYERQARLTSYRATREQAQAPVEEFDFNRATRVELKGRLQNPHALQQAVYRVTLSGQAPDRVFPTTAAQQVRRIDGRTAEIQVRRLAPGEEAASADPPSDEDREPNALIQSEEPAVRALAESVAADQTEAWPLAVALERLVHDKVSRKDYTQGFNSAADVARQLRGDCTEHAVLLTALCRARGLPARVVSGLIATRSGPESESCDAFAFHMWTEVWIGSAWIPLDATLGRGGIGAGHLTLAASNLAGASGFAPVLLPVLPVIGRLQIEVVQPQ